MKRFASIFILTAALAAGCSAESTGDSDLAGGKADLADGNWQERIEAEVAALRQSDPSTWRQLSGLQGKPTRPGYSRIRGEIAHHGSAAAVFLTRYLEEPSANVRATLVEALPRTRGHWEDAVLDLMASEPSEEVRAAMAGALATQDTAASAQGIGRGLQDQSLIVRLESAVAAAAHPHGASLESGLRANLGHEDARVRAASARALGVHQVKASTADLTERLSDADAGVRLAALRALTQIDAEMAESTAARLELDSDPRVRNLVAQLRARR